VRISLQRIDRQEALAGAKCYRRCLASQRFTAKPMWRAGMIAQ